MDSLKKANDRFDRLIHESISEYEEKDMDFLIFRKYDSVNYMNSRCRILSREDTCTTIHELHVDLNFTLGHTFVGRIESIDSDKTCYDELKNIYNDLTFDLNYMVAEKQEVIDFKENKFTLYGKINGAYVFEIIPEEYLQIFYSGLLHHVLCTYLTICEY